ncbi:hypothetical protein AB1L30_04940 [Bremerella sp. JC817]|uniref:hypothetical protein n=1 Tax=Bremerella sp. JC817 TaxID=3231756 RepID=UPI003458BB37
MKSVNYYVLGQLFRLLERVELIDGVFMGDYDPDNPSDVEALACEFLWPSVREATQEGQMAIRNALIFYSSANSAPIQTMKDRCQELTLPDADSWPLFFNRISQTMFGDNDCNQFDPSEYIEIPDETASEFVLMRKI